MIETIKRYLKTWLDRDASVLDEVFSDDAVYTECYGPQYHGLKQIHQWFKDWNKTGTVLEWAIRRMIEKDNMIVVEWYFKCDCNSHVSGFDGVTIAEFDDDKKIKRLSEYQSKADHVYPYD